MTESEGKPRFHEALPCSGLLLGGSALKGLAVVSEQVAWDSQTRGPRWRPSVLLFNRCFNPFLPHPPAGGGGAV